MANIVETKVAVILLHKLSPYDLYLAFNVLTIFEHDHLYEAEIWVLFPLFSFFLNIFSQKTSKLGFGNVKKWKKLGLNHPYFTGVCSMLLHH